MMTRLKNQRKLRKRVKNFKKSTLFSIILVPLGVAEVLENNNNSYLEITKNLLANNKCVENHEI